MATAYETLKRRVDELQKALTEAEKFLSQLRTDARYLAVKAQLAAGGNTPEWIASADNEVKTHEEKIRLQQATINDILNQLRTATNNLTEYENSSPTVKAEIEKQKLIKNAVIWGGIILVVIVIGSIIFVVIRKNKKQE